MHKTLKQLKKIKIKKRRPVAPPSQRGGDKRKETSKRACRNEDDHTGPDEWYAGHGDDDCGCN